jgi:hypothetical protein
MRKGFDKSCGNCKWLYKETASDIGGKCQAPYLGCFVQDNDNACKSFKGAEGIEDEKQKS